MKTPSYQALPLRGCKPVTCYLLARAYSKWEHFQSMRKGCFEKHVAINKKCKLTYLPVRKIGNQSTLLIAYMPLSYRNKNQSIWLLACHWQEWESVYLATYLYHNRSINQSTLLLTRITHRSKNQCIRLLTCISDRRRNDSTRLLTYHWQEQEPINLAIYLSVRGVMTSLPEFPRYS